MTDAEAKTSFDDIESEINNSSYSSVEASVSISILTPDEAAMVISFFANQIRIIFEATFSQAFDSRVSVMIYLFSTVLFI